jgi:hypothetical protein
MSESNNKSATSNDGSIERRTRPHLRDMFERAYDVAYPLLDSLQNLKSPGSAHFLRVTLHDAFPELHQQDIAILSVSVECVYRKRSKSENQ